MKHNSFKHRGGGCGRRGGYAILSPWTTRHRRHQQIQAELGQIGITLPGSLTSRTTRCQRPGCHCRADPPVLHGPYPTWTRKAGARSITRTLTPEDAERLRPYFAAHRRLRQLIDRTRSHLHRTRRTDPTTTTTAARPAGRSARLTRERPSPKYQ